MNKYLLEGLNALASAIHDRNIRVGFYEADKVRPFDGMLMNIISETAEAQEEWRRGHKVTETHWTVIETGQEEYEITDSLKDDREGNLWVRDYDDDNLWHPMTPELLRRMPNMVRHLKPEGIPSELADIIIRTLDICAYHGIDIAQVLADKMAFNETRAYRHGGKLS